MTGAARDAGIGSDGDPFAQLDGAYVLGALEPGERAEFEDHLLACPMCRARVDELRPTIGLLAAARASGAFDTEPPGPVPETLLPGLLRRAAREQRRRRWLLGGVGGLAAACLLALLVVVWPGSGPSRPPVSARPVALHQLRPTPVEATAALVARRWGTEIDVRCRYEHYRGGIPSGVSYGLRVIDTADRVHDAGSWALVPGVTRFTGGTDVRRERIARVQIVLPDGTAILQRGT